MSDARLLVGDALERLRELPDGAARCCVTSPPYYALRDYGVEGQIGLEDTVEEYVERLVEVFREVRRVLAGDGTLWLNIGDCYAGARGGPQGKSGQRADRRFTAERVANKDGAGCKPKDLMGVPWMLAFALRADGWWLRSEIIWAKTQPMPESVTDRPTKAHETVFFLAKSSDYYYDVEASSEPSVSAGRVVKRHATKTSAHEGIELRTSNGFSDHDVVVGERRRRRTVWTLGAQPFKGAHFATFPEKLVEPCVLAGSAPGDVVLDPFAGSGTTGAVALRLGRDFVGVELSAEYAELARGRVPGLAVVPAAKRSDERADRRSVGACCDARPFVRRLGGKSKSAAAILAELGPVAGTYYEPFLGGGAVFLALDPAQAILSDADLDLIAAWRAVRDDVDGLCAELAGLPRTRETYLALRDAPSRLVSPGARAIYLSRCSFNGLWRVNASGQMNAPAGDKLDGRPCLDDAYEARLRAASARLGGVEILCVDFESQIADAGAGDVVFADPPYPGGFVSYTAAGFGSEDHARLARACVAARGRGARVLVSGPAGAWQAAYEGFQAVPLPAMRSIAADGQARGVEPDVLLVG